MFFARWDLAFVPPTLHLKHLLVLSITMYLCSCLEQEDCKRFSICQIFERFQMILYYMRRNHIFRICLLGVLFVCLFCLKEQRKSLTMNYSVSFTVRIFHLIVSSLLQMGQSKDSKPELFYIPHMYSNY